MKFFWPTLIGLNSICGVIDSIPSVVLYQIDPFTMGKKPKEQKQLKDTMYKTSLRDFFL